MLQEHSVGVDEYESGKIGAAVDQERESVRLTPVLIEIPVREHSVWTGVIAGEFCGVVEIQLHETMQHRFLFERRLNYLYFHKHSAFI